jgi:hypothetical protein
VVSVADASVALALRQHAPAYLAKFGQAVPTGHRKVLDAITRCRPGELGGVVYRCDGCGREHWVGRSCGNRHCPGCQQEKTSLWLAKQTERLLSVHHFLVTFTVPQELRLPLRGSQSDGYRALMSAAAESLRDVANATRSLKNCRLGYFAVLHTWGRDPTVYHPHVHIVVSGGGVEMDEAGNALTWKQTPKNFLVHHDTLCRVYKGKLTEAFRQCGIYQQAPESAWEKKSVVDIQGVGDGRAVLKYLAPYVHRVAISDKRIARCNDSSVTFTYTPSGGKQTKTRRVSGETFVGGFCQHILPRGFQKVRYYGWMAANSRVSLDEVKWLVWIYLGWTYWLASGHAPQPEPIEPNPVRCAACGASMRIVAIINADCRVLVEHSQSYLDSG